MFVLDPKKAALLFLILLCIYLVSCRYNRVSVIVKNASDTDFKALTVRYGDTLQIFKEIRKGERTPRFVSNKTFAHGYARAVLADGDTLVHAPINRNDQKFFYNGRILSKIKIVKTSDQRDTLEVRTRRRLF